jgi:replicative DNA helicase
LFADAGAAVVAVSAIGRQKDKSGRTSYAVDAMGLGAFRESSELEFGADSAFIIGQTDDDPTRRVLKHLKARHGELSDVDLRFDGALQTFTAENYTTRDPTGLSAALADLWASTEPAAGGLFDG